MYLKALELASRGLPARQRHEALHIGQRCRYVEGSLPVRGQDAGGPAAARGAVRRRETGDGRGLQGQRALALSDGRGDAQTGVRGVRPEPDGRPGVAALEVGERLGEREVGAHGSVVRPAVGAFDAPLVVLEASFVMHSPAISGAGSQAPHLRPRLLVACAQDARGSPADHRRRHRQRLVRASAPGARRRPHSLISVARCADKAVAIP